MANEASWKLLFDLSGDATDQVVVVEKPLGRSFESGVTRSARGEEPHGALERASKRRRRADMRDEPRRPLEVALGFGERARVCLEACRLRGVG